MAFNHDFLAQLDQEMTVDPGLLAQLSLLSPSHPGMAAIDPNLRANPLDENGMFDEYYLVRKAHHPQHKGRDTYRVTQDIPRGTRIFAEPAIIRLPLETHSKPEQVFAAVQALPADQSEAFYGLFKYITGMDRIRSERQFRDIWEELDTNEQEILACRQGFSRDGTLCQRAGFIDISYNPNCAGAWNENLQRFTVHAIQDIARGKRLSMSHNNLDLCGVDDQLTLIDRHVLKPCGCHDCIRPEWSIPFWETKKLCVHLERLLKQQSDKGEDREWKACWEAVQSLVEMQVGIGASWELGWALDLAIRYAWALFLPGKVAGYLELAMFLDEVLVGRDNPRYQLHESLFVTMPDILSHQAEYMQVVRVLKQEAMRSPPGPALTPAGLWMKNEVNVKRRMRCVVHEVVREKRLKREGWEERVEELENEGRWLEGLVMDGDVGGFDVDAVLAM